MQYMPCVAASLACMLRSPSYMVPDTLHGEFDALQHARAEILERFTHDVDARTSTMTTMATDVLPPGVATILAVVERLVGNAVANATIDARSVDDVLRHALVLAKHKVHAGYCSPLGYCIL